MRTMQVDSAPKLILASRSARRRELLHQAGFIFEQCDPPFQDPPRPITHRQTNPKTIVAELAKQKALSVRNQEQGDAVVLGADTLCVEQDGRLVGQPTDRSEAYDMIRALADQPHMAVTGVVLIRSYEPVAMFVDSAQVTIGPLSDQKLNTYLQTDGWRGKAGGYNLFDRIEDGWRIEVVGDPTTVVGLPIRQLKRVFQQFDIWPVNAATNTK